MPNVRKSVIIPVRNGAATIGRCLEALVRQQDESLEIVVVDDGSDDETAQIVERYPVRLLRQPKVGAAAARNRGIREASGEILLFTDADCVAHEEWVERLSRPITRNGFVGVVGRCDSKQKHWVASLIQLELDERYSTMAQHDRIDYLNTGNCAFRREVVRENLFDETFPWLEDVELSFRLAGQGREMVLARDAVVEHPHPESFWAYLKRKFHYASCAPRIYRLHPEKALSDSRTPLNRRLQLLFLGLAAISGGLTAAALGFEIWNLKFGTWDLGFENWGLGAGRWGLALALLFLAASIASSGPLILRAFRRSPKLGLLSPFFVLGGNAAFVAGTLRGLFGGRWRVWHV